MKRSEQIVGLGDFQTPLPLARSVLDFIRRRGVVPGRILEPTCGAGSFVAAAFATWGDQLREVVGIEVNPTYAAALDDLRSRHQAFRFDYADAQDLLGSDISWQASDRLLICGNLPWVTTDALSRLTQTYQTRVRDNPKSLKGLDALTGSASFDISERLALHFIELARAERSADIGFLLKESVARRILLFASDDIADAAVVRIDSHRWFGVKVASCLLYMHFDRERRGQPLRVDYFNDFFAARAEEWSFAGGVVRRNSRREQAISSALWRHGVKHDAASVFEFTAISDAEVRSSDGATLSRDSSYVFPFVSTRALQREDDVCRGATFMLVPQHRLGDESIESDSTAQREREYLNEVKPRLSKRRSSIYKNKPHYAIFGVGDYTFAPFKVAVAGLYMTPRFRFLGRLAGKPCVLGDTSYFAPCDDAIEAALLTVLANSGTVQADVAEMAFAGKRPITKKLLDRLNLGAAFMHASRESLFAQVRVTIASWKGELLPVPADEAIAERAGQLFAGALP